MIESTLNVSAGNEGGRVVWEVEEVTRSFSEEVSECAGEGEGGGSADNSGVVTIQTRTL